jgi:hypothetical protein
VSWQYSDLRIATIIADQHPLYHPMRSHSNCFNEVIELVSPQLLSLDSLWPLKFANLSVCNFQLIERSQSSREPPEVFPLLEQSFMESATVQLRSSYFESIGHPVYAQVF